MAIFLAGIGFVYQQQTGGERKKHPEMGSFFPVCRTTTVKRAGNPKDSRPEAFIRIGAR
jgi:hypothetical protein